MLIAVQEQKHVHKTLWEKGQALQNTEKGLSNKQVAAKYINVNTISTWVKNKDKILSSLKKGQNIKPQKLRGAAHKALDQAVFKWFLNIRSQNVLLLGAIIEEKASSYAKDLSPSHPNPGRREKIYLNFYFHTL